MLHLLFIKVLCRINNSADIVFEIAVSKTGLIPFFERLQIDILYRIWMSYSRPVDCLIFSSSIPVFLEEKENDWATNPGATLAE